MKYDEANISTIPAPPRANIEFMGEVCWKCPYVYVKGMCGQKHVCGIFKDCTGDAYQLFRDEDLMLMRCPPCKDYVQKLRDAQALNANEGWV